MIKRNQEKLGRYFGIVVVFLMLLSMGTSVFIDIVPEKNTTNSDSGELVKDQMNMELPYLESPEKSIRASFPEVPNDPTIYHSSQSPSMMKEGHYMSDLTISELKASKTAVHEGDTVRLLLKIENRGLRYVRNADISLFDNIIDDNHIIISSDISFIGFSSEEHLIEWKATSIGAHTLYAVIDPQNIVKEKNEENNIYSSVVEVVSQNRVITDDIDLSISAKDIVPDGLASIGKDSSVDVVVHNNGDLSISDVYVEVYEKSDNELLGSFTIPMIPAYSTFKKEITWVPSASGTEYLEVKIDPKNAIPERDENNNAAEAGIYVIHGTQYINPPNCNITSPTLWSNDVYVVSCDLIISSNLTVDNANITMNTTSDGQYKIQVYSGGLLLTKNNSIITSTSSNNTYKFIINANGTLDMSNTTVQWTWGDTSNEILPGGIQIYTNQTRIQDSTIREGRSHGLWIKWDLDISSSISGNLFIDNSISGILVRERGSTQLSSNNITGNEFGIYNYYAANSTTISANNIDNGTYGIYNEYSSPIISYNNDISNNAYGIYNEYSSPNISYNNDINNNVYGIYNEYSSPIISNNNDISNNVYGISNNYSSPTISGNQIISNSEMGIRNYFSSPIITNNTISGDWGNPQKYGIFFVNNSNSVVTGNDIELNKVAGLWIEGPANLYPSIQNNPSILGNNIGIYIYFSSPKILNNTIDSGQVDTISIETVDSPNLTGLYTSIALDTSNNPCISYYDQTLGDLRFAQWKGTYWSIGTVDSSGDVGQYTSIAIDSSNNAHISYYDVTNGDLKYAIGSVVDGYAWTTKTVDSSGNVGRYSSIALDSNEEPRISYQDSTNADLKYARKVGSTWQNETVDWLNSTGYYTSIAIDSYDRPHISHLNWTSKNLRYSRWTGTQWVNETVDSEGDVGRDSSIAIDSNDNVHISYRDLTNSNLKYAKRSGSVWTIETVDSDNGAGEYTSIDLDSLDRPRISYYFDSSPKNYLRSAAWVGGEWRIRDIDASGDAGLYTSIAVDIYDNSHVSYFNSWTMGADLKYAKLGEITKDSIVTDKSYSNISGNNIQRSYRGIFAVDSNHILKDNTYNSSAYGASSFNSAISMANESIFNNEYGLVGKGLNLSVENSNVSQNDVGLFIETSSGVIANNTLFALETAIIARGYENPTDSNTTLNISIENNEIDGDFGACRGLLIATGYNLSVLVSNNNVSTFLCVEGNEENIVVRENSFSGFGQLTVTYSFGEIKYNKGATSYLYAEKATPLPNATSGSHAWYLGPAHSGAQDRSLSRTVNLTGLASANLTANMWLNIFSNKTVPPWPRGIIEAGNDTGWSTLGIMEGRTNGWEQKKYSLDDYAGQTIEIRFRYDHNDWWGSWWRTSPGWLIDDISVNGIVFSDDVESGQKGWDSNGWFIKELPDERRLEVSANEIGYISLLNTSLSLVSKNNVSYLSLDDGESYYSSPPSYPLGSNNNIITYNKIGSIAGLYIRVSSNNTIAKNAIYGDLSMPFSGGIVIEGISGHLSFSNMLERNYIMDSYVGVDIYPYSSSNRIHHNFFIRNIKQASDTSGPGNNTWDDGYPSGGNFWSDYSPTCNDFFNGSTTPQTSGAPDRICDDPYPIPPNPSKFANPRDRYPIKPTAPPTNAWANLEGGNFADVNITWTLSIDDGSGYNDVTNYAIYYSTNYHKYGFNYEFLTTVPAGTSYYVHAGAGEGDQNNYFYYIQSNSTIGESLWFPEQVGKYTENLAQGSHLSSVPLRQQNTSVQTVLQTLNYSIVWFYDASAGGVWKHYNPAEPPPYTLTDINHTMGFVVNVSSDSNLTLAGQIPLSTSIPLYYWDSAHRWNMVGYPSFNDRTVGDALQGIPYDRVEDLDEILSDDATMSAGNGYWVRVTANATWVVENE